MFVSSNNMKFIPDSMDSAFHGGLPQQFNQIKNKRFGDWEIPPWELFIFKDKRLGSGSFSDVYLAKWRETYVVAKVIRSSSINLKKHLIDREIDTMTKMHHPNVVQFLGYIEDPLILVMEYIPRGDLAGCIDKLWMSSKISIAKDILRGLVYIHNRHPRSLVHRDIKATNILLTKSKVAKIADFGLSKFYTMGNVFSRENLVELDTAETEVTKEVGTRRYMAPEILLGNYEYTFRSDIYSCGIVFYELFEGTKYEPSKSFMWARCPKKIRHIIKEHMANPDPDARLTAETIIKMF